MLCWMMQLPFALCGLLRAATRVPAKRPTTARLSAVRPADSVGESAVGPPW